MKNYKILQIVRHGKSGWDYEGIADIDRPLKSKGIKSSYEISRKLKLNDLVPDLIISSPANRALHTAIIFAGVFNIPFQQVQINKYLYESSAGKIIDLIKETPDEIVSLMIVGHNPDFTDIANSFLDQPVDNLPTSGVVALKFNANSWGKISKEELTSHQFIFPNKDE
jgi:phosphohistidine phosphatase